MKLLNKIDQSRQDYVARLQQIAEQVEEWNKEMKQEKRLGLKPMEQLLNEMDPPINVPQRASATTQNGDVTEFRPKNVPGQAGQVSQTQRLSQAPERRIHIVYNPQTGEVEGTVKTGLRSRPPAEYTEANADQVVGAMRHLEKLNPQLADKLVNGQMSVWIPRNMGNEGPTSVKHLGLSRAGNGQPGNVSPNKLAGARNTAQKMQPEDQWFNR